MSKPKHRSKTLWVNGAVMGLGVFLTLLTQQPGLQDAIPDWAWGILVALTGAVNAALRLVTTGPVE
jgi:hypothetical protein